MLETIWQDVRHGARMLAKNPGFALAAILSIAIGVGANAAMFSVADGLIFRPLPVPAAGGLVTIRNTTPTGDDRSIEVSYPDYADLRDRAQSFEGLAAIDGMVASLTRTRGEPAQGTFGQAVSANFFDLLHVRPALGRWFRSTLLVRTDTESAAIADEMRAAILETDRDVPILSMRTMEAFYYANARNLNTVVVRTIALMGIMGLALALVGLYALMAYAVSRRTREIGIRMAVGALPTSVLQMILRQGSLPSFIGIAAGVAASAGVGGLIQAAFPGTGGDAVTYLTIVPVVLMVVALASYIPARRAARIDPLVALRQD